MKKFKRYYVVTFCIAILCFTMIRPIEVHAFDKTNAKKNISVSYQKLPNGILAIYKNKNKSTVSLSATMHFRDGEKKDISNETQKNLCLRGKSSAAFFFQGPLDVNGNYINYSSYKGSYSVAKSKYKSYSNKISISSNLNAIEGTFAAVNLSSKTLKNIHVTVIFYDGDGEILDCSTKYLNCFEKNSIDQFSISYAGKFYQPNNTKIYIDWAY